ncbi:alpha-keto acid decarboxylase family protein [Pseudomaricurvus alcaniphilus]|uniref:alpha-keto acid decarboxylase family protein n=1 Tax=Pseudomaricurvus alcaniphilus TaxID=1166482 RepID=UPI001408237E|nr:thiamine pyrophosphate-binding protein [Pseudomaricurvus alcaniphilus]NHN35917.1 alpha-keto acid decarboxylase family protein [Pseudomaricurvus alcaniphilus]
MQTTVADYLKTRLEQLGLEQMFGVAGNYTAALLDTILADSDSPITISGNPNEICAGFAADAYARYKGIGAVYVTYSVGAFTALNTIAGAYVEHVPIVLINGAPTRKETVIERQEGLLYSHTTGNPMVDISLFRPVTVAAERIIDAGQAPYQIDAALTALLTYQQPVYIEVAEDVWRAACCAPERPLRGDRDGRVTVSDTAAAVAATLELTRQRPRVLFWAGIEIQRQGLEEPFLALMAALNRDRDDAEQQVRFVTSALSKGVVSEDHPLFDGCVTLTEQEIESLTGDDGCLIGIGGWTTSKNTGSEDVRGSGRVLASAGTARVGARFFASVELRDYIEQLTAAVPQCPPAPLRLPAMLAPVKAAAAVDETITYDSFFQMLSNWLGDDKVLVADAGFPLIGAQSVHIASQGGFLAQAAWLAIGYSVPAATGVKCALPDKRVVVAVGDGAFHETCQAVSDHHHYGHNTVVFVIKNGLYGIEQFLVNPNPFRQPPVEYPQRLQNAPYAYNALPAWNYEKVVDVFGGKGSKVETLTQLRAALAEIDEFKQSNFVVEVTVPETSVPGALSRNIDSTVGEDETANPDWPPANKF